MKTVYLDNGASTRVDPIVVRAMFPFFTEIYANPSSLHNLGQDAKRALEDARKIIAKSINATPEEIIFTSGGTESNNLAIKGYAFANKQKGNHIITSSIEHKCVLEACKWLESQGFKITRLSVDGDGFIDINDLKKAITKKTILVSIIHGNNEIGTIQDITTIAKICKNHKIVFHTDACQSYTKVPIDVKKQHIDMVTLNSHKIHGPKGVGALYIRKGVKITPLFHGGGHEHGLRSGTENVAGIVGFAKAVKIAKKKHIIKMAKLRDYIIREVTRKIPKAKLNGPINNRLCNNVNFSFPVDGELLGDYLNSKGICTSKGSACNALKDGYSHVLKAIGCTNEEASGSIRITLSRFTTKQEVDYMLKILKDSVRKLEEPSLMQRFIKSFESKLL